VKEVMAQFAADPVVIMQGLRRIVCTEAQDCPNHRFVSQVSIDHGMVDGTVGPLGVEVPLDERGTLKVDSIHLTFLHRLRHCLAKLGAVFSPL